MSTKETIKAKELASAFRTASRPETRMVGELLESMAGKLETVQRAIEIWNSNASICRGSETQELGFLTGKAQAYETAARELGAILETP
jgi:hypothetical protein